VELQCFRRPEIPTVVKRRFVYEDVGHKVFEVCTIDDSHPPVIVEQAILKWIREQLEAFDLVIVSDYGHGVITADIASALQSQAVFISVNAQTNSANVGYNLITKKYSCVNLACIDESEARLAGQDKHKDIEVIGNLLLQRLAANCLIITRGRKGSVAFEKNGSVIHCPSFAIRVVDRVGAGDDFFTIASLGAKLGISTKLINFISNAMGALSVQVIGNRESISAETFKEFVKALLD
jgi:bifunctional ADP-heptose synthase (sugar kinase/adenylyltransferase)